MYDGHARSSTRSTRYPQPMYAPYFGLEREPFSLAPDPRFLYLSERHREALAHLLYGIGGGGGNITGGAYRSKDGVAWEKKTEKGWLPVNEAQ